LYGDTNSTLAGALAAANCTSRLRMILADLAQIDEPVIFPVHPRTRKVLESLQAEVLQCSNAKMIDPVGYLDMVRLTQSAGMILTDSGGLQKESYWLGVHCVTLRDETEWLETVQAGMNVLARANTDQLIKVIREYLPPSTYTNLHGDGIDIHVS